MATKEDNSIKDNCIRTVYPCHKGEDVIKYCEKLGIEKFSDLVYINEEAWRTKDETRAEGFIFGNKSKNAFIKAFLKKEFYQEV